MVDNRRWIYLAIGTLLLIFCGLIYGWSLFKVPFGNLYPEWALSQLSMTFTISMISFCTASFVAGKLSAFLKSRYIIMMSATLILIGFIGVSKLDPTDSVGSLIRLYIFYGVFGGSGVGMGYNNVISTVNQWFPDRQGFASGTMMMGFGMGALILGSVASSLVESKGVLNAFFVLGVMIFIVLLIGSLFIRNPEEGAFQNFEETVNRSKTTTEMLKSSEFKLFFCWGFCLNTAGLMIINSAAPIALAYGAPALVGMIVAVFNGIGRLATGAIFDKVGRKKTMLINSLVLTTAAISLIAGAETSSIFLILFGLICIGLSYGGNPTTAAAFINKQFWAKYFAVNFSVANFSAIPAALLGPLLSSSLIERSNGSYETTFMMILIFAGAAFASWALLNNSVKKCEQNKRKRP